MADGSALGLGRGRRWAPAAAAVLLGVLLLLTALSAGPAEAPAAGDGRGDAFAYAAIIEAVRGGEDYYGAAHRVLLAENYGTRSVFNWRLPGWTLLLAALPPGGGQILLGALAVLTLLLGYRLLRAEGGLLVAGLGLVALAPSLGGVLVPQGVVFSEVAAGLLIALSVVLLASGWRAAGVAAGVAALLLRELALPFVGIALLSALLGGRRREALGWGLGLVAFAAYFGWHWMMVEAQLGPLDRAYPDGWVQFGGLRFVLSTAGFNGLWGLLPGWTAALALPLGLYGLWRWPQGGLALATVLVYVAVFLVIGKPFNAYWGAMYTPVLMLGAGWGIVAIGEAVAQWRGG